MWDLVPHHKKRFSQYYSYKHIADPNRNMIIDKALLKYGYSNFQLEILEYCDRSLLHPPPLPPNIFDIWGFSAGLPSDAMG